MLKLPLSINAAVLMDIRFVLPVRATVHADGANRVRLAYRTRRLRLRLWFVRVFVRVVAFACGADSVQARTMPVVAPVGSADPATDLVAAAAFAARATTDTLGGRAADRAADHARQVAARSPGGNGDGDGDVEAEK